MGQEIYLSVQHIQKHFPVGRRRVLKAVDDVSFDIARGETLALVGESGCGKSTLGKTVMGLYRPTGGRIFFEGKDMTQFSGKDRREFALNNQMIFQDPFSSLNPRRTVGDIVAEGIDIHGLCRGKEREARITELLGLVGLNENQARRYPHEFSGGQRQRIGIARALALNPKFIVCDEPISALDVSIQAQIVNLMRRLQRELNLTYLFIAHDLNMVRYISDRIVVMYLGKIMEIGKAEEVYSYPAHPYSQMLIRSVPIADPVIQQGRQIEKESGEIPSPMDGIAGCPFAGRCKYASDVCRREMPAMKDLGDGHFSACHMQ